MDFTNEGSQASFLFEISGLSTPTAVVDFSANEAISRPYSVVLTLLVEGEISLPDTVIGKEGVLTIVASRSDAGDADRYFHGIIKGFEQSGHNGRHKFYRAELVPSLWRLSLRKNCRIFQEMNVQDIVKQILDEAGVASNRYRFSILNKERMRGFCVQYRETDYDFICRLLQEEGLFYFFQHDKDSHLLIISDDKTAHPVIKGGDRIPFNGSGMAANEDCISAFSFNKELGPQTFCHSNFNFKKPTLDLTASRSEGDSVQKEIYDYPALHTTEERGNKLAKVRLEELVAQQKLGRGKTSCCRLIPGYTFILTGHESETFNMNYLLLKVTHSGVQPQALQERSDGRFSYDVKFTAIPASVPFRPPISIDKPCIAGMQTAIVVGPPGQEIYTDEYGRIKVRFHWDRATVNDGNSSCWLRINQPWSGSRWGMIAIPRVGDEVLVAFLEGDPDRPIMMGNVNNADSPALYRLPANQTQTGIRTQSTPNGAPDNFNELRFEDKKGREHVYLQAERDWNILIKNDKGQIVGHDETLLVKNNRDIEVGGNHTEAIGANKTETVAVDSKEKVGVAKEIYVGGAYAVTVIGGMNTAVGLGQFEEVGLTKEIVVGKSLRIQAGESIEIVCGNSVLTMEKGGKVTINGSHLDFSALGPVQITGNDINLN